MQESYNSEHKLFIRGNWSERLLKFLSKRIDTKLIYLGLPSPSAEDILQWINYIKLVIAFQCRVYGEMSDSSQDRTCVEELDKILLQLEKDNKIETYLLFDGYLEEVILRGYDNSPKRINFELTKFITLYNLDFCNKITSPLEFINQNGDLEKVYKFNAINKLLQIQKSLSTISDKFVFSLTVHCSYDGEELYNFINDPPDSEVAEYIKKYNSLTGYQKNSRIVRLFVTYLMRQYSNTFSFNIKTLPTILYKGLGDTYLLHFTMFGRSVENTAGGIPSYQSMKEILDQKFITVENSEFININDSVQDELDVEIDPIKCFVESLTYKKMWL